MVVYVLSSVESRSQAPWSRRRACTSRTSRRRRDLLVDLAEAEQRLSMSSQRLRHGPVESGSTHGPAVGLVVVLETERGSSSSAGRRCGRSTSCRRCRCFDARARPCRPRSWRSRPGCRRGSRRSSCRAAGWTRTPRRRAVRRAGREEEPVGIGEQGEGRRPERIRRDHVQRLHPRPWSASATMMLFWTCPCTGSARSSPAISRSSVRARRRVGRESIRGRCR